MKQKFLIKVVSSGERLATVELDKDDDGYVSVGCEYHKVENYKFVREIGITRLVYWELTDDEQIKTNWYVIKRPLMKDTYSCGYCGRVHTLRSSICPNCGAKMCGDKNESNRC